MNEHRRIVVRGVGKCEKCGIRWPCLAAAEAAIKRGQQGLGETARSAGVSADADNGHVQLES